MSLLGVCACVGRGDGIIPHYVTLLIIIPTSYTSTATDVRGDMQEAPLPRRVSSSKRRSGDLTWTGRHEHGGNTLSGTARQPACASGTRPLDVNLSSCVSTATEKHIKEEFLDYWGGGGNSDRVFLVLVI